MTIPRQPPAYGEKACAECGAPFTPASGRQRFCEFHQQAKFRTERDTESKRRRRSEPTAEDLTRPPQRLPILLSPNRKESVEDRRRRTEWVADALRLARRLHRDHRLGLSQQVVEWATRTANGEVELLGCHHLGSLVDDLDFRCYGPHVVSALGAQALSPTESKRGQPPSLPPAETPPGMSDSGVVLDPVDVTGTPGLTVGRAVDVFLRAWAEQEGRP
jgi:hypothetical protein